MKVLHINSYYSASGKPTFYKNLFDTQVEHGLDISVFVPMDREISSIAKEHFGEYSQVVKTHGKIDRYLYHLKQGKILKETVRKYGRERFDIIHAHSLFTNGYVARKISKELGITYIVAVRNTDVNTFFRLMPHLRNTGIRIMLDAARIVFLSNPYMDFVIGKFVPEWIRESLLEKSVVIPNGIDEFWLENRNQPRISKRDGRLKLLTIGEIVRNKNHVTTAKAAMILINRGYDVNYTVVGEIKDQKIMETLKKHPFVRYLPKSRKEKLLEIYREADIFVLPSITETFGLVYPEAMSQGLPVIYSKGQGFDGQYQEGTVGFHVESRNAEEIADKIVDITRNYETISSNCIDLCGRFNWEDIAKNIESIYQSAM